MKNLNLSLAFLMLGTATSVVCMDGGHEKRTKINMTGWESRSNAPYTFRELRSLLQGKKGESWITIPSNMKSIAAYWKFYNEKLVQSGMRLDEKIEGSADLQKATFKKRNYGLLDVVSAAGMWTAAMVGFRDVCLTPRNDVNWKTTLIAWGSIFAIPVGGYFGYQGAKKVWRNRSIAVAGARAQKLSEENNTVRTRLTVELLNNIKAQSNIDRFGAAAAAMGYGEENKSR